MRCGRMWNWSCCCLFFCRCFWCFLVLHLFQIQRSRPSHRFLQGEFRPHLLCDAAGLAVTAIKKGCAKDPRVATLQSSVLFILFEFGWWWFLEWWLIWWWFPASVFCLRQKTQQLTGKKTSILPRFDAFLQPSFSNSQGAGHPRAFFRPSQAIPVSTSSNIATISRWAKSKINIARYVQWLVSWNFLNETL